MMEMETAVLGGGCFWCLEGAFQRVRGVSQVVSGYAGGQDLSPTYEAVCSGNTGHAEVVQVRFDPEVISYETLLELFFALHDPTTLNRQGADVGTQYRSVIFYQGEQQRQIAQSLLEKLDAAQQWPDPIVTQLEPLDVFFPAENYHQNYFNNHSENRYCQMVVAPKLKKFFSTYPDRTQ
jgi:peptide-methionine (S)-S-oxide reductase